MDVVVNMVLAVAAIAGALGAVAELQAGIGQLRAAADGAAEAGLTAASAAASAEARVGVDVGLLHLPLPALMGGMIANEIRQDIGGLLAEEKQIVGDGHQGNQEQQ